MKIRRRAPRVSFALAVTLTACDLAGCDFSVRRTFPPPPEGSYTVKSRQLVVGNTAPATIETADVTGEFFKAVQVQAALGRLFATSEYGDASAAVAVLSQDLWKRSSTDRRR